MIGLGVRGHDSSSSPLTHPPASHGAPVSFTVTLAGDLGSIRMDDFGNTLLHGPERQTVLYRGTANRHCRRRYTSTLLAERVSLTRSEPGQYRALEWHEGEQQYKENPQMGVLVEVTVCSPFPLSISSFVTKKTCWYLKLKPISSPRLAVALCRK